VQPLCGAARDVQDVVAREGWQGVKRQLAVRTPRVHSVEREHMQMYVKRPRFTLVSLRP
jgi:hypothetical protein